MTAPDLLPCPWCGHKPRMWEHHAGGCEIECVNGHCPSEPHVGMPTTAEAITAWNTRAPLAEALAVPEVAALVEAAKVGLMDLEAWLAVAGIDDAHNTDMTHYAVQELTAALRAIGERADG